MLRPLLIAVLLPLLAPLPAQTPEQREAAIANFDEGVVHLLEGRPKKAVKPLERAVKLDSNFLAARRLLGISFEVQKQYEPALEQYLTVLQKDSSFSRLLYFQVGEMLYKLGAAKPALSYFDRFQQLQFREAGEFGLNGEAELEEEAEALKILNNRVVAARITSDSTEFINVTTVSPLPAPINSRQDDYFPFFSNDLSSLLYTHQMVQMTKKGPQRNEDLMRARRRDSNQKWTTSSFGSFNTKQPEGMCTLVRDGETIFFTLCHEETGQGGCDLYSGVLVDNKIQYVEALPDYINTTGWESQAAISCDGQQLFFASIRPEGLGGSDLYRCHRLEDGSWSEPENLGPGVNTPLDEEAPFLSNDGGTLFFASMGHNSLGDQDIFMSLWNKRQETWTQAINLGPPVNSPSREIGFHLTPDGKSGYFASDRPRGLGGLDIYEFKLSDRLTGRSVTFVSGYVLDSTTMEPIADQAVPVTGGDVYYTNYAGRFFICAPSDAVLPLSVDNPDYLSYDRQFAIPAWPNNRPYRIDLLLQTDRVAKSPPPPPVDTVRHRETTTVSNLTVRFSFDDASLTIRQIENINKFVELIKGKKITEVQINGYTDSVGGQDYNVQLSQERARAVSIHLKAAGIEAEKFRVEGLGELTGSGSVELNRKVEVQVTVREMVAID